MSPNGQIYTSTDSGVTWIPRDTNRNWTSVASSADGTKLAATTCCSTAIYTSVDSGVNWTPRESGNRDWLSIASSADGSRLVAVIYGGQIYTSVDFGVSWRAGETNRNWNHVTSSAGGEKLAAVVGNGLIYTLSLQTATGTAGYLTGGTLSSIELQYIGNGRFLPLSNAGIFVSN